MRNERWRRDASFYDRLDTLATRYTDVDSWRHLNNVSVLCLHLEARTRWLVDQLGAQAWHSDDLLLRPASFATDFLDEGRYPGNVEIGARCLHQDEAGWDLASAVFQGGACFGVQQTRMTAWCDGRPVPLSADMRAATAHLAAPADITVQEVTIPAHPIEAYPSTLDIRTRFADNDADGCLGEVAIARYMEQARASVMGKTVREASEEIRSGKLGTVVAHSSIRFLQHRRLPEAIHAGVGVVKLGNSSKTIRVGLFHGADCLAVGDTVLVVADKRTARPAALPQGAREALQRNMLESSAQTV